MGRGIIFSITASFLAIGFLILFSSSAIRINNIKINENYWIESQAIKGIFDTISNDVLQILGCEFSGDSQNVTIMRNIPFHINSTYNIIHELNNLTGLNISFVNKENVIYFKLGGFKS